MGVPNCLWRISSQEVFFSPSKRNVFFLTRWVGWEFDPWKLWFARDFHVHKNDTEFTIPELSRGCLLKVDVMLLLTFHDSASPPKSWWFQIMFCFHPENLGNDPIWRAYFFKWVGPQPLTRRISKQKPIWNLDGLKKKTDPQILAGESIECPGILKDLFEYKSREQKTVLCYNIWGHA